MEDKNKKTPAENVAFMLDYETGYLQSALDTLALAEELIESLRVSVAEYDRIGANKLGRERPVSGGAPSIGLLRAGRKRAARLRVWL